MRFSQAKVEETCKGLDTLLKRIIKAETKPDEANTISPGEALLYWLVDLLRSVKLSKIENYELHCMDWIKEELAHFGNSVDRAWECDDEKWPVLTLSFFDRILIGAPGRPHKFNLSTCKVETQYRGPYLELIAYDMGTLYRNKRKEYIDLVSKEVSNA